MRQLLIVTGGLFLGLSPLALGQTEDAPPEEETVVVRLPPVVVTARKWTEDVRDLPQSITVIPGTFVSRTMSSIPWCDGPSSPVMPARSRQKMTGWPWRPQSRFT